MKRPRVRISNTLQRQGAPWLFVEFVAIAAWLKDGDSLHSMSVRLQRPVTMVRDIAFGGQA